MWNNIKRFLIVASVTLNIAFAGVWIAHSAPRWHGIKKRQTPPATTVQIWCPLHEQLDVSDRAMDEDRAAVEKFRDSAQSVSKQIGRFRSEVLDLIAMPAPDREAIAAKQEEIRACQRKMQDMVVDHLLAEKEILTAEQENNCLPCFVSIVAVTRRPRGVIGVATTRHRSRPSR